ncbi:glycoside hydrolase family 65 protein [Thermicanus aegyptius]|uniref:glycoside hydrolase family 65 protein n=1 Tax=Thermicanus aegyptius TaxID=94009 RepID=UPI000403F068|nr:glycoside hydrolase family 65 protein [Thermicanus aegyptius]
MIKVEENGWIIAETAFHPDFLGKGESLFAQGNGYMGVRASHEEEYLKQVRNFFVAGTFNAFDGSEATELPNGADVIGMEILLDGERFTLERGKIHFYRRHLDMRIGELIREIIWESQKGKQYRLFFRRFVSLKRLHLLAMRVEITPLSTTSTLTLTSGVNGRMTNSGTQHFREGEKRIFGKEILRFIQTTTQSKIHFIYHVSHSWWRDGIKVQVEPKMFFERRRIDLSYTVSIPMGTTIAMEKVATIHTSRDREYDHPGYRLEKQAEDALCRFRSVSGIGYFSLLQESAEEWESYWNDVTVELDSEDSFDQAALRFAQYHLLIMTPAHDPRFGIGAKGLTGEGYKGHSFWDSEIFILPYFLFMKPKIARGLLKYRYHTLGGARKKAKENGYGGAMYPWESAFTGEEETPKWGAVNILTGEATRIWSGDIEQHITCDIAYSIWQYYQATGDTDFMEKYGYEMLFETATFWTSRVEWDEERNAYAIRNVIGPDEYKEHVDNNAYTNYMVARNLASALAAYEECKGKKEAFARLQTSLCLEDRPILWKKVLSALYLPKPREDGVIPQDDTYLTKPEIPLHAYRNSDRVQAILLDYSREEVNRMQVSKQADVVMLMDLLSEEFPPSVKQANLHYYEPRTIHDSSLSMAVHSIVACDAGERDLAYQFFKKACRIDLSPNPSSSDAGIHAASLGGIWRAAIQGFAGIRSRGGILHIYPVLPKEWRRIAFPLHWKGNTLRIEITPHRISLRRIKGFTPPVNVVIWGKSYMLDREMVIDSPEGPMGKNGIDE